MTIPVGIVMMGEQENSSTEKSARSETRVEQALGQVRKALAGLQYGQIVITVQDGTIVQIERIERVRLGRTPR